MKAATRQMMPAATPMYKGRYHVPSKAQGAQLGELSASQDAARAISRLTPKAKLSSLPLNYFASAVVTATISGSAPIPSTKRAASIDHS